MNVMRMEKGFKGAGELTNEVTLAEADVLRFARTDKDYLGRDKTLNTGPALGLRLSGDRSSRTAHIDGHGGEAVLLDGEPVVGSTASVAYRPHGRQILAFAYLKPEAASPAPRWRW
jgi:dimethylglycine dehydrogenase